jgi:aryl-alcohol dehydrogenase-like predicted oxidoreductase
MKGSSSPVVVASKFMPLPWRLTHGSFRGALSQSLERLGMKSMDLYQVHGPAFSLRNVEVWAEAMADAHRVSSGSSYQHSSFSKDGLIKAIGVSNYNVDQMERTHRVLSLKGIPLATNQVEFSILRNNPEHNGLLAKCNELGVSLIAYSPLGMGRLTGKYNTRNPPQGSR